MSGLIGRIGQAGKFSFVWKFALLSCTWRTVLRRRCNFLSFAVRFDAQEMVMSIVPVSVRTRGGNRLSPLACYMFADLIFTANIWPKLTNTLPNVWPIDSRLARETSEPIDCTARIEIMVTRTISDLVSAVQQLLYVCCHFVSMDHPCRFAECVFRFQCMTGILQDWNPQIHCPLTLLMLLESDWKCIQWCVFALCFACQNDLVSKKIVMCSVKSVINFSGHAIIL